MKKCSTCIISKEHNAFAKNKAHKDGLQNECRDCSNLRNKGYRIINKDGHITYHLNYKAYHRSLNSY